MVTITQHRTGETTQNIVILDTTECAEEFLDRLSGNYWGLPGFNARREPGALIIEATVIGGTTSTTTYKIENDAA